MADIVYYDNHTLFVRCGCATEEQIMHAFIESICAYKDKYDKTLECKIKVNRVENKNGVGYGIAFVFVTNPIIYNVLLGRNPDGSERIEYYHKKRSTSYPSISYSLPFLTSPRDGSSQSLPSNETSSHAPCNDSTHCSHFLTSPSNDISSYVPTYSLPFATSSSNDVSSSAPCTDSTHSLACFTSPDSRCDIILPSGDDPKLSPENEDQQSLSWVLEKKMLDAQTVHYRVLDHSRGLIPFYSKEVEPMIPIPSFKLTDAQKETQKVIEDNKNTTTKIEDRVYFIVERAMAIPVDAKYMPHILKCKNTPLWVTKQDIKREFTPFASNNTIVHSSQKRNVKGKLQGETYPYVNINDDRVAFVVFDPDTVDAYFALHMMKKTIIRKKLPDNNIHTTVLIFNHAYRTDRDNISHPRQESPTQNRRTKHMPLLQTAQPPNPHPTVASNMYDILQ